MKLGLVMCGGGSKGAYELGVWDALKELKLDFSIVTGSSIGALNGAMYVQGDYDIAERLWSSVKTKNLIKNGFDIDEMNVSKIVKNDEFKSFLKHVLKEHKTDIEPFKELLRTYINTKKLKESKILYGISITQVPLLKNEEILINELDDDQIVNHILASCSMFPFFPMVEINNKKYIDGGFSDNLPIEFAFKLGATRVVAIDLNHKVTHPDYLIHPFVDYIYPKYDLGSFLNFTTEATNKNRKLGYLDAWKHFGKYVGFKYTFEITNKYENQAKLATLRILNDSIAFKNSDEFSFVKKIEIKDIFSYLNQYIHTKISDYDYFLKCLEEICMIFEVEPSNLYKQDKIINELIKRMSTLDTSSVINEFVHLKTKSKKVEYFNTCDKRILVSYFYQNKISEHFRLFLFQINVELYLSLVLIEAIGRKNEV